ncbi:type II secretion system protein GspG [Luteolibacter marinus]|uniref:type II secretion system protein GspG n=1 Tax=Luteolibacter marinus TaxID=2776705 RepID=UPI00186637C8|nr:type II secretion system protein GspG [Luteolibacter marinus]
MLRSFSYSFVAMIGCLVLWLGFDCLISGGVGSKPQRVLADFQSISSALKTFKTNAGHYPTTEQGLHALVERPSVAPLPRDWMKMATKVPTDPWQNEYRYRRLPEDDPCGYEIISLGPDGIPSDDDISSLDE